ncbi:MAG TPA: hypothetical protein VJU77_16815 [Chthoniobacterales bacterium]|nr:hypothetical protein [Chthoniobacterales bacterium]
MSEIRRTTTIDKIDVPPRVPLISFSEVITAIGWIAYQGTKFAVKGAITGSTLAYKGGKALAAAAKESRERSLSLHQITQLVDSAATAKHAVVALAAAPGIELPRQQAEAIAAKLKVLVAKNDKAGLTAVARDLVLGRQDRLRATLVPLVAESCEASGFVAKTLSTENGLIAANRKGTRQSIAIEVAKGKEGGIQLHFDAEGFEGGTCVQALDAIQHELRTRGVHCDLRERRRKHRRPVFDRSRVGNHLVMQTAR